MLRSNCKKVKERIRKYMLECARDGLEGYLPNPKIDYDGYCTKEDIEKWPMTTVERIFLNEHGWEIARYGRYVAFEDWIRGLCSALPVYDGYYDKSRERLAEWMEQTEAESMRYEDDEVDNMIIHLLFREYTFLLNKEQSEIKKEA